MNLRHLTITAESSLHLRMQLDDDAPRVLQTLSISTMYRGLDIAGSENILKCRKGLQADDLSISSKGGFITGSLSVGNSTVIDTSDGATISELELTTLSRDPALSLPSPCDPPCDTPAPPPAPISTLTGTGLSTFTVANPHARPLLASHVSASQKRGEDDLRLEYAGARFSGRYDVDGVASCCLRGTDSELGMAGGRVDASAVQHLAYFIASSSPTLPRSPICWTASPPTATRHPVPQVTWAPVYVLSKLAFAFLNDLLQRRLLQPSQNDWRYARGRHRPPLRRRLICDCQLGKHDHVLME